MTPLLAPAIVALLLAAQAPETVAGSTAPATETPVLETTAVAAAPETSAAGSPTASGGRVLRPGDEIRVVVADQSEAMTLNPDGEVFLTGLGAVALAGRAAPDAARHLAREIRGAGFAVADTEVAVFLVRAAPEPEPPRPTAPPRPPRDEPLTADSGVTVLGEVARPGIHPAGRLTGVLAAAGGTTDRAAWRLSVRLADGTTERLDLYAVLRGRAPDAEIPAGAVLHVPRSVNPLTILRDLLGVVVGVGRVAQ